MPSLLSHMVAYVVLILMVVAVFAPGKVEANQPEIVYVQDTTYPGEWGLFSRQFVGVKLPADGGLVTVIIRAGDYATGEWVVSFDIRQQSYGLFENEIHCIFESTGTYWFYLAMFGTDHNFDYLQMRIVPSTWEGEVTPNYQHPPFNWRTGYPPYGVPFNSDGTAGTDGAVATLPSPTITTIPSPRSSKSTSTSVWLAPLLVGIIMIAITVPIVIFTYKKGKQNSKPTQVEADAEAAIEMKEQQQCDQANRVQV